MSETCIKKGSDMNDHPSERVPRAGGRQATVGIAAAHPSSDRGPGASQWPRIHGYGHSGHACRGLGGRPARRTVGAFQHGVTMEPLESFPRDLLVHGPGGARILRRPPRTPALAGRPSRVRSAARRFSPLTPHTMPAITPALNGRVDGAGVWVATRGDGHHADRVRAGGRTRAGRQRAGPIRAGSFRSSHYEATNVPSDVCDRLTNEKACQRISGTSATFSWGTLTQRIARS